MSLDLTASQSALIVTLLEPSEPPALNEPPEPPVILEPSALSDLESLFISDFLSVLGDSVLTNATVTNTLTLNQISSLDGHLDFLSGLITLDASGSLVTINGDLRVTGQLTAPILDEMSLQLASLSAQINELTILRSNDQTLMASLSAQVASLSATASTPSAELIQSELLTTPPSARLLQLATQP